MKGFYEYIEHKTLTERVALLMVSKGVDPYAFIDKYLERLDAKVPINEGL